LNGGAKKGKGPGAWIGALIFDSGASSIIVWKPERHRSSTEQRAKMKRIVAITNAPSPLLPQCELTHLERTPIDYATAVRQHQGYQAMLRSCGAEVHALDVNRDHPDGVFIEDTAIVLDEIAVVTSMGTESRRGEPDAIEAALRRYRSVERIKPPATIEGGDVVLVGRTLLVGQSSRTNAAGAAALGAIAGRHGYRVISVPVTGCLHLKSACTALPDGRLLANLAWIDAGPLASFQTVSVPAGEPSAADVAFVGETVCLAAEHPETARLVESLGFTVRTTPLSEFAKAEGAVTCLSLIFSASARD
jgi:dimethylargininase